jgi:hypothetical protein
MARKRYKYAFTRKKHTKGGKLSSILAFASFLLFVGSAICSMMMGGKGGLYLGAAGFIAIGFSVYGFILGLKSFSEENRRSDKRAVNSTLDYDVFDWNWMR